MSNTTRPLPTTIGPTENALRRLLLRQLRASPIPTYEEWAVVNLVASAQDGDLVVVVTEALQVSKSTVEHTLARLDGRGLIERRDNKSWCLTEHGAAVLAPLRDRVSAMSAALVTGISEQDLHSARAVLDLVRARALSELRSRIATGS